MSQLSLYFTLLHKHTPNQQQQPNLMIERIIDSQTLNQVVEVVKDVPVERITEQIIEIVKEGN